MLYRREAQWRTGSDDDKFLEYLYQSRSKNTNLLHFYRRCFNCRSYLASNKKKIATLDESGHVLFENITRNIRGETKARWLTTPHTG
jgi:hypothetical protein